MYFVPYNTPYAVLAILHHPQSERGSPGQIIPPPLETLAIYYGVMKFGNVQGGLSIVGPRVEEWKDALCTPYSVLRIPYPYPHCLDGLYEQVSMSGKVHTYPPELGFN